MGVLLVTSVLINAGFQIDQPANVRPLPTPRDTVSRSLLHPDPARHTAETRMSRLRSREPRCSGLELEGPAHLTSLLVDSGVLRR